MKSFLIVINTLFFLGGALAFSQANITPPSLQGAQPSSSDPSSPVGAPVDVTPLEPSVASASKPADNNIIKHIEMSVNATETIRLHNPADQVIITDPKVADAQSSDPKTLEIFARAPGTTELIIRDQGTKEAYRYEVYVKPAPQELENVIRKIAPYSNIKAIMLPQGVLLQGEANLPKRWLIFRTLLNYI